MKFAFAGVAGVLHERGILTMNHLRVEIPVLVSDTAVAAAWWPRPASDAQTGVYTEQFGHYWFWGEDCPYFFWNGHTVKRAVVGIAERTLAAVFKKSGVKKAHAHCFRHTLATRLLEQGTTFEQVADILGNSPAVDWKHYGKWSKGRQANIDRLMFADFQTAPVTVSVTPESHEKMEAVN